MELTDEDIATWMDRYLTAWHSTDPVDIAAVFTEDASSFELPYDTECVGLPAIIEMWEERAGWSGTDSWTFDWQPVARLGETFVITGTGHYPALGAFANLWVVSLGEAGRATTLRMWNREI